MADLPDTARSFPVILEGRQPKGLKLATLLRGIPLAWEEQRRVFGVNDIPEPLRPNCNYLMAAP